MVTSIHEPSPFAVQPGERKLGSLAAHRSPHFESIMQDTLSSEVSYRPASAQETVAEQRDELPTEKSSVVPDPVAMVPFFNWVETTQPDTAAPLALGVDFAANRRGQEDAALSSSFNTSGQAAGAETANHELSASPANSSGWHRSVRDARIDLHSLSAETHHLPPTNPAKLEASLQKMPGRAAAGSDAAEGGAAQLQAAHKDRGSIEASSAASASAQAANAHEPSERESSLTPALLVADAIARSVPGLARTSSAAMTAGPAPSEAVHTSAARQSAETVKRLRVKLHPAELGEVEVCIVMKGTNLNIQLRAETRQAKQSLMSSHFEMLEALSAHGLRVENLLVELASPDAVNFPSATVQSQPHYSTTDHQQRESRPDEGSERSLRSSRSEQASQGVEPSRKLGVYV